MTTEHGNYPIVTPKWVCEMIKRLQKHGYYVEVGYIQTSKRPKIYQVKFIIFGKNDFRLVLSEDKGYLYAYQICDSDVVPTKTTITANINERNDYNVVLMRCLDVYFDFLDNLTNRESKYISNFAYSNDIIREFIDNRYSVLEFKVKQSGVTFQTVSKEYWKCIP